MKNLFSTLTLAAMLGLGAAGAASASGPAGLAPMAPAGADDLVSRAGNACGRWGCGGSNRHYRGDSSRVWRDDWNRRGWNDRYQYRRYYRPAPSFHLYVQPRVIPRYVQPAPVYRLSSAHVAWCHDRYRSYRSWDNSWQPYSGPRRVCVSPYR